MKRFTLLVVLGMFLQISDTEAQTFIASFGVEHHWDVPHDVRHEINHRYRGYDWVHAKRHYRNGHTNFDIILQRGGVFIEVSVGANGYIHRSLSWDYYPLNDHICDSHCGYHASYYRTYYVSCNRHSHYGHNHVVFNSHQNGHHYKNYRNHGYDQHATNHGHRTNRINGSHRNSRQSEYNSGNSGSRNSRQVSYSGRNERRSNSTASRRNESGGGHRQRMR